MKLQDIDRYCDLFEQRLKAGQDSSIERFLEEHGLPQQGQLVAELIRLKREYAPDGKSIGKLQAVAETFVLEQPRESTQIEETLVHPAQSPPAQSMTNTANWSLDKTWQFVANQPGISVTTSIKSQIDATIDSQTAANSPEDSNLVIQQRSLKPVAKGRRQASDYDLLNLLGQGGMGMVYAARQASIDRTVAIKTLKPKIAEDPAYRTKFLSEACVTGDLEHPNIVPIYDLGRSADGALFYAMKRVQGTPWDKVIAQKSLAENLEILMRVSDAIAFAHAKGIVHRDLKPENIMLGGYGEVLVMDWGLAIPTDMRRTIGGMKQTASMGGTPAYMAPEMAAGPFEQIGPASDIYLLGAMLYEFTTGLRPHTGKNVMGCLYAATRNIIQPTDKHGELIDIALRAMEFEPTDRYPTVTAFQDAIRAYQSHSESIIITTHAEDYLSRARSSDDYQDFARALYGFQQALDMWAGNRQAHAGLDQTRLAYATSAYAKEDYDLGAGLLTLDIPEHVRLHEQITVAKRDRDARQQRLRTYKRVGLLMVLVFVVVVSGAAILIKRERDEAVWQRGKAVEARDRAEAAEDVAEQRRQDAVAAQQQAEAAQKEAEAAQLAEARERRVAEAAREQERLAKEAEAYEAYVARVGAAVAKIDENAYDSARELLLACLPSSPDEPDYRNWEWGRLWYLCQQASQEYAAGFAVEVIAYHPAATGEFDAFAVGGESNTVRIWQGNADQPLTWQLETDRVHALAFSPDGQHVAVGTGDTDGFIQIRDARDGTLRQQLGDPATGLGHAKAVLSIEYSADGMRLLTSSRDGTAKVWDVASGAVLANLHGHRWWVWQARFCPRRSDAELETQIVTVSQDGTAVVWSDATGQWRDTSLIQQSPPFRGHRGPIYAAAFSPDGQTIATAGHDQRILLWKRDDVREFDYGPALSSTSEPTSEVAEPYRPLIGHTAPIRSLSFSGDGRLLASGGHDNTIKVWSVDRGQTLKTLRGHGQWVRACALSPDGRSVLSAGFDHTARLWNIAGYQEVRVLQGKVLAGHEDAILAAAFSNAGDRIVTASRDRTIKTWAFDTGQELKSFREGHAFLASDAAFFANGGKLATAAVDGTVRIWDVESGTQQHTLQATGRSAVVATAMSDARVLTGGPRLDTDEDPPRWSAKLWDGGTGQVIHELLGHSAQVTAVAMSDDGSRLFTGDLAGLGILWDAESGDLLHRLSWHGAKLIHAAFVEGDRYLLTAGSERVVARWDVQTGTVDESRLMLHPTPLVSMDASPDGRFVVTSAEDNRVRLWDLVTGGEPRVLNADQVGKPAAINKVTISQDGRLILAVNHHDRSVRVFECESGREITYPQTKLEQGPFLQFSETTPIWSAGFAPDGRHILTVGGDQVRLWELNEEQVPFRRLRMNFSPHGVVSSASFSSDGTRIVSGSFDGTAIVWDAASGTSTLKFLAQHSGAVNSSVFSPDPESRYVLTASDDGSAILWNAVNGDFMRRYIGHQQRVLCAVFSRDLQHILTTSADQTVCVWDINDGQQPLKRLEGHSGPVLQAAFSPDGTRVISAGADNVAKIWDLTTGTAIWTLAGHTAAVTSVAFSQDGRRLLTGSEDFHAKLWDARSGKELLTLKGHEQEVTSVAFSNDDLNALTASHDGTAIIWMATTWDQQRVPLDPQQRGQSVARFPPAN